MFNFFSNSWRVCIIIPTPECWRFQQRLLELKSKRNMSAWLSLPGPTPELGVNTWSLRGARAVYHYTLGSLPRNQVTLGIQSAVPASPRQKVLPPEPDDLHCSLGMVRPVKQGPGSVQPPLHTGMMDGNPRRNYDQTATPSPQDCEVTQLARQPATCTSWASWPQGAGYRTQVFQPWPDSSAWELGQGPERPGSVRSRSDPLSSSRAANPGRVSSARASGWQAVRSGGHTQGRTHTPGKIAGALGPRHLTRLLGPRPSRAQPPGPPAAGGAAAARE